MDLELGVTVWLMCSGFLVLWLIMFPYELINMLKLNRLSTVEECIATTATFAYLIIAVAGAIYYLPIFWEGFK